MISHTNLANAFADVTLFPITEVDLKRIGKTIDAVKYHPDHGHDYVASLEVFHQLHCLVRILYTVSCSVYRRSSKLMIYQNFLRKYSYLEYYTEEDHLKQPAGDVRDHLDHCIEILRINLMCTADVTLLTYSWVQGLEHPTPDFNTRHKCRDFQAISTWADNHRTEFGPLRRVGGEIELDHLP